PVRRRSARRRARAAGQRWSWPATGWRCDDSTWMIPFDLVVLIKSGRLPAHSRALELMLGMAGGHAAGLAAKDDAAADAHAAAAVTLAVVGAEHLARRMEAGNGPAMRVEHPAIDIGVQSGRGEADDRRPHLHRVEGRGQHRR